MPVRYFGIYRILVAVGGFIISGNTKICSAVGAGYRDIPNTTFDIIPVISRNTDIILRCLVALFRDIPDSNCSGWFF